MRPVRLTCTQQTRLKEELFKRANFSTQRVYLIAHLQTRALCALLRARGDSVATIRCCLAQVARARRRTHTATTIENYSIMHMLWKFGLQDIGLSSGILDIKSAIVK